MPSVSDPLPSLSAALAGAIAWLESQGLACAVIGGVAASLLGRPRTTRDVDLVTSPGDQSWQALVDGAAAFGIRPRIEDVVAFAEESRVLLMRHEASAVDVDVSLGALPFEHDLVARAVVLDVGDLSIPVARPEDLIVMKAVAGRPRDLADIEGLLDAHPEIDTDPLVETVRRFAELLAMPELASGLDDLLRRRK